MIHFACVRLRSVLFGCFQLIRGQFGDNFGNEHSDHSDHLRPSIGKPDRQLPAAARKSRARNSDIRLIVAEDFKLPTTVSQAASRGPLIFANEPSSPTQLKLDNDSSLISEVDLVVVDRREGIAKARQQVVKLHRSDDIVNNTFQRYLFD